MRLVGKVIGIHVNYGVTFATVSFPAPNSIPIRSTDYNILIDNTVNVGDNVVLAITAPSEEPHPMRRSTDGPAIEGHPIAVIRDIREKDEDEKKNLDYS